MHVWYEEIQRASLAASLRSRYGWCFATGEKQLTSGGLDWLSLLTLPDDLMVLVREGGGGAPQRSFGLSQDPCEDKPRENFSTRKIHDLNR